MLPMDDACRWVFGQRFTWNIKQSGGILVLKVLWLYESDALGTRNDWRGQLDMVPAG